MKYISIFLTLALLAASSEAFAADGWKIDEIGKNSSTGESIGRYVTFTSNGRLAYKRKEFLDPQLIGAKSAKYTESFYINGVGFLRLDHFPDRLQSTFNAVKDFTATLNTLSDNSELQIRAISLDEEKEYTWTKDKDGFFSKFSFKSLQFTDKQKAVHKKLKEMQPQQDAAANP